MVHGETCEMQWNVSRVRRELQGVVATVRCAVSVLKKPAGGAVEVCHVICEVRHVTCLM